MASKVSLETPTLSRNCSSHCAVSFSNWFVALVCFVLLNITLKRTSLTHVAQVLILERCLTQSLWYGICCREDSALGCRTARINVIAGRFTVVAYKPAWLLSFARNDIINWPRHWSDRWWVAVYVCRDWWYSNSFCNWRKPYVAIGWLGLVLLDRTVELSCNSSIILSDHLFCLWDGLFNG